jgi:hypothetical protein
MPEVATPNQAEREFETGSDEFFKAHSALTATNAKRTYDAYQDLDLASARRAQLQFDQIQNIALQALQNSVETANMVAKQAVRHSDIAIDNQWNPVQQGTGDNLTGSLVADTKVAAKAVDAATAKAVDATTTTLVATLTEMLKVLSAISGKIAGKG